MQVVLPTQLTDARCVETPAIVFDEAAIREAAKTVNGLARNANCRALYSLKACSAMAVLDVISPHVDGFSCSSAFEAKLVGDRENEQVLQIVSPGLTTDFLLSIQSLSPDLITFNSVEQFFRLVDCVSPDARLSIRVNPKTAFVKSTRYDPCRVGSKLGATVPKIRRAMETDREFRDRISGIHFHNNCESEDFGQLAETVRIVEPLLRSAYGIDWINLGGGYQFDTMSSALFVEAVDSLASDLGLEVFFEPGNGIVREAGYLVSSIVDLFQSDGDTIAILDTTVNHAPEVFEYEWSPPVADASEGGEFQYTLAGCSCLAGDLFGKYRFRNRLEVGQRVTFGSLGAYAMPKWSTFNGINLPNVYLLTEGGELLLKQRFTFDDFASRCGVPNVASL